MNIHIKFKGMFGDFVYVLLQAFLWLQIFIFSTYFFYPKTLVAGNDAKAWLHELAIYHLGMQKIFYVYSIIFLTVLFILFWRRRKTKIFYTILILTVFTVLFAFFATRGHTWYFYSNSDQTVQSIVMTVICLLLSFSLVYSKKLFAKRGVPFRLKSIVIVLDYVYLLALFYLLVSSENYLGDMIANIFLGAVEIHDWRVHIWSAVVLLVWVFTFWLVIKVNLYVFNKKNHDK